MNPTYTLVNCCTSQWQLCACSAPRASLNPVSGVKRSVLAMSMRFSYDPISISTAGSVTSEFQTMKRHNCPRKPRTLNLRRSGKLSSYRR